MLRNAGLTGLLLLAGGLAAGCGRQCYLQECDFNHYHTDLGLPNNLESNPHDALVPTQSSECPHCHEPKPPHRACPHCGYYRGRQVRAVDEG